MNGNKIKTPNDYLATTVLPNPKTNKPVIAISGGSYKAKAVKAAIEGGLINGLITDEDTVKKNIEWLIKGNSIFIHKHSSWLVISGCSKEQTT